MEKYDIIIIGSGLGGLACAYILAKEGYKVCVLEKNRQFGGNLQIFVRDRVIFDTGVHYLGGLDEGQNLYQYFKYFNIIDKLKLKRMDEDGFDRILFRGDPKEYRHAMTYERFIETLVEDFPKERQALEQYCNKLQEICRSFPLYNVEAKVDQDINMAYVNKSAKEFIESCTDNYTLQNILAGSNALYAGYPDKSPLYAHALVSNTYIESSWKCVDGGSQIARHMVRNIKDLGGELYNYTKVDRLVAENGRIKAALTDDGRVFEADSFISNTHPSQTLDMVQEGLIRKIYRKRIKALPNSISVFTVHIVFKEKAFPYLNYNYYCHASGDAWGSIYYRQEEWPEGYAFFIPASSKSDTYAEGMNVMAYMRFEEVAKWQDTFNTIPKNKADRGAEYEAFKHEKAEKLIDALEEQFPDIRSKIKSYHTSSPLSFRDYIGTSDGSLYGIRKDYNDPLKTFISPRTKVPNLFLTGQNLNMHGILGVTVSSIVTCAHFLEVKELIGKIRKA